MKNEWDGVNLAELYFEPSPGRTGITGKFYADQCHCSFGVYEKGWIRSDIFV